MNESLRASVRPGVPSGNTLPWNQIKATIVPGKNLDRDNGKADVLIRGAIRFGWSSKPKLAKKSVAVQLYHFPKPRI